MRKSKSRHKRGFWRTCRLYFRGFRIVVWLLVLALVSALVYVNQVGLPDFVKRPLLQELRARGIELQFSRLRWRWHQGIVAENVRFGRADEPTSPSLSLDEVQLRLNLEALTRFQLQIDSLMLRRGRFVWSLTETNQPVRELAVANIQTELRFLPQDQWALDRFGADFEGSHLQLSGLITNASAVSEWKLWQRKGVATESVALWQNRLRRLADTLESCRFANTPELVVDVRGNARDLQSFSLLLLMAGSAAETPWGALAGGFLTVRLSPATSNQLAHAQLKLEAAGAQTRWGAVTNFQLAIKVAGAGQTNLLDGALTLSARQVQSSWAGGSNVLFTARWLHSITNPVPISGRGEVHCDFVQTEWASARDITLQSDLDSSEPAVGWTPDSAAWSWWTNLQPYRLNWDCHVSNLRSTNLQVDALVCGGSWRAPRLTVTNLQLDLYQGRLQAEGNLDVATREASASISSDFDVRRVAPLLGETGSNWLGQLTWQQAPRVQGNIALVLPVWTNRQPDWRAEVQPTVSLAGEFVFDQGAVYREVQVSGARSHFTYSNMCWHLPDLTLTRPEGTFVAEHRADERSKVFYWHVQSSIDPLCIQPLLEPEQRQVFDLLTLTQPPVIDAEIWGISQEPDLIGARGRVALTNFTFRSEAISGVQSSLAYTNRLIRFFDPHVQCGSRNASADGLAVDLRAQLIYLTNGLSNVEPMLIARAIGPNIVRAIESYQFLQPPTARVRGTIPLHGEESADLHFDLDGGPFHWWKFNLPHIAGHVHWVGKQLTLENIQCGFYGGQAAGSAAFNFRPSQGTDFEFAVAATNAQLHELIADVSSPTNHLQGLVSSKLVVNKANTEDWRSVQGFGDLNLRDGLIWDLPVFGIFSPVLNSFSPGLGNSRASAAVGTFNITNGVIRSNNLEIRSTAMRLQYRGTVDLQSRVNAHVEAELLKDMWVVGPVISTLFWPVSKLFESKVTGSLGDPKTEPIGPVPKIVLIPFHPLRTLKGLFPEDAARTNAVSGP